MIVGCISSESRSSPGSLYEPLQISVCGGFRFSEADKKARRRLDACVGLAGEQSLKLEVQTQARLHRGRF